MMKDAKTLIELFAKRQEEGFFPCPRCGRMRMDEKPSRNALSRRAHVQICDLCGTYEAVEDTSGTKLPLEEWAIMKYPKNFRAADAEGSDCE